MYWGAGPDLGLLTVLGYLFFVAGAAYLWRARESVFFWFYSEASVTRRTLSRYTPIGPFYGLREESRFKAIPSSFIRSLSRLPRSRVNGGALLLLGGLLLFLLDFFL